MSRTEFLEKTKHYQGSVGGLDIVLNKLDLADFVIGCYYDEMVKNGKSIRTMNGDCMVLD